MAEGGKEGINLFALSLDQLNQLKQSIEEELQGLNGAIQQLQVSRNKLTTSKEALTRLSTTEEGTAMLVPITSSLYVPGETTQIDTLLVDVGTGAPWLPARARPPAALRRGAGAARRRRRRARLTCDALALTGYFIEKSVEEAQSFLTRKMALIESQAQNVQSAAQFKNQNLSQTGARRAPARGAAPRAPRPRATPTAPLPPRTQST